MSYNTNKNWIYSLSGKNVHLWQITEGGSRIVEAWGYKIRMPDEYYGSTLVYPQESITNGLRYEGTAFIEPFVNNDPNELIGNDNPGLSLTGSVDETKHLNFSRMLSLAVVDYVKAQLFESRGDVKTKEYYMKEFWKKVGDNESNKRIVSMTFPMSPYGVR